MLSDLSLIQPVILAGGTGRRLWPLSTPARPKPFLRLPRTPQSLLQATLLRVEGARPPLIVANIAHRSLILQELQKAHIRPGRLLLEGQGRGTAPALGFAAHLAGHREDPLLLVMPSDHRIDDVAQFHAALRQGMPHAVAGKIVTFGIPPRRAASGFGYIKRGAPLDGAAAAIDAFVEKPPAARARAFLRDGSYLWNSGLFLLRAHTALASLPPALSAATGAALRRAAARQESVILDESSLAAVTPISIDRAIMEHTDKGVVIAVSMGWSDIGTWPAFLANIWR